MLPARSVPVTRAIEVATWRHAACDDDGGNAVDAVGTENLENVSQWSARCSSFHFLVGTGESNVVVADDAVAVVENAADYDVIELLLRTVHAP